MQLYKQIERIMKNKKYNAQIEALHAHRSTDVDTQNDMNVLKKKLLPVYQEINAIVRSAQKAAEAQLLAERPDIIENIKSQMYINNEMKKGNVEGAAYQQKKNLEKQKLLQFGGTR